MDTKSLVSSKTFWVNLITFFIGVLTLLSQDFVGYLTPDVVGGIITAVGALNILLRVLTTTAISSVFEKD